MQSSGFPKDRYGRSLVRTEWREGRYALYVGNEFCGLFGDEVTPLANAIALGVLRAMPIGK